jgi:hypothetical protein
MSLQILVETYSDSTVNEQPIRFHLDDDSFEIASVQDHWEDRYAKYFKVGTTEGKQYLLRCDMQDHEWTLQSGFDGSDLVVSPGIQLIAIEGRTIQAAIAKIAGCGYCRGEEAYLRFDWIIAEVLAKEIPLEFFLTEPANCPTCHLVITEKTLIEPLGGIQIESLV